MLILASLVLPAAAEELLNYPLDTVNGEEVYRYQVEKSIGLYRVGVNFNVSQSEIIRFNPQLKERGLHYGETLLIPTGRPVIIETKPRVVETTVKEERVVVAQQPDDAEKPVHDVPAELNDETVVVVMETGLIFGALLKGVLHHQPELDEKMDGIIECGTTDPEIVFLHLFSQFFQGKMAIYIIDGLKDGKTFRGFPALVFLKI